jgi:hypothetical protein
MIPKTIASSPSAERRTPPKSILFRPWAGSSPTIVEPSSSRATTPTLMRNPQRQLKWVVR